MKLQGSVNGGVYPIVQESYVPPKRPVSGHICKADEQKRKRKPRDLGTYSRKGHSVLCVETGIIYESITEAAKLMHVSDNTLGNVVRGKKETCRGYHWRLAE